VGILERRQTVHHELKSWPDEFQAMWEGRKRFDVRIDDRHFALEDDVTIREYDPAYEHDPSGDSGYTGRTITAVIQYIYRGADESAPVGLAAPDADDEPVVLGLTNLAHVGPAYRPARPEREAQTIGAGDVGELKGSA
jgi:hypothetical protein